MHAAVESGPPRETEDVGQALELSRLLVTLAYRSLEDSAVPLSLMQMRALAALVEHGSSGPSALGRALGVSGPAAARLCDHLVGQGLVRRERRDHDRQQVDLSATPAGHQLAATVLATRSTMLDGVFARLDEGPRRALAEALPDLLAALRSELDQG